MEKHPIPVVLLVTMHLIKGNPQAWDSWLRRESLQVYIGNNGTIGTNGKAPYSNGSIGEYASIEGS